jgi:hypothetical protein
LANIRLHDAVMDHIHSHRVSLALLTTVMMSAGVLAPVAGAADGGGIIRLARVLPDEPLFQCIAPSEYEIAGLRLYGNLSTLHRLGLPTSLTRGFGEDDGGGYIATTYHYDGLDVTAVRGKIDVIEARSPLWPTPSGLKAGMPAREARSLLGREPDPEHLHDGAYSFVGCPEWRDGELVWDSVSNYFEFGFGDDEQLSFVRLAADRP